MKKQMSVINLGKMDYQEALDWQNKIHALRVKDVISDILLIVEHPPTITIGRSGSAAHILMGKSALEAQGVSVHEITRGGDVTYHGPGQVVGYPIIKLEGEERDLHQYLHHLEEIMIQTLQSYKIVGSRKSPYTGTWVENKKIGAIGVAVQRYVTLHGFAFNVCPDMKHFQFIVPCGIQSFGVTSLKKLGIVTTMEEVTNELVRQCGNVLKRKTIYEKLPDFIQLLGGKNSQNQI